MLTELSEINGSRTQGAGSTSAVASVRIIDTQEDESEDEE